MTLEDIKLYLENILEHNKAGIAHNLMREAQRMYPPVYSHVKGEHPFDINYKERDAYYRALEHAYKDALEKITDIIDNEK